MKTRNFIFTLSFVLITALFADCKKKNTGKEEEKESTAFDKSAMLANYADNIIIPNLRSFKTGLDSFADSFHKFVQAKNNIHLSDLRQKFIAAYSGFQYISAFEFGPSESEIVRSNFNTYPTNTVQINANIHSGSYNLATISNLDAKGFPAIDYLLFGRNEPDASIISRFDTDPGSASRIAYVNACLGEMQAKTNSILAAWNANYRNVFVSSNGSQIGSSLGLLVNQLNFEIDALKNGKIGIPLGKKSLGVALPEKCEGYFAHSISVRLAKECLLNIENIYLGRSVLGNDGKGLDDYLDHLDARHGSETLNSAIKNQFAAAKSKINLINEPLSASVVNSPALVDAAYLELVKLLVLMKTDTPSALGIVITYQDGDGD